MIACYNDDVDDTLSWFMFKGAAAVLHLPAVCCERRRIAPLIEADPDAVTRQWKRGGKR